MENKSIETMKAVVIHKYGGPEQFQEQEVPKPQPSPGRVIVKVKASSLNALDWRLMEAKPFIVRLSNGLFRPKQTILASDIAGVIESVGEGVEHLRPGDEVFGEAAGGGMGEYVSVPEKQLGKKPANLSFEEAAAIPVAGLTALQGLRNVGNIQPGQDVLIYGASGGVGSFAVQLAKCYGANVTAVCSSGKMDQARALGADRVVDYRETNVFEEGKKYDIILAAAAKHRVKDYKSIMKDESACAVAGFNFGLMVQLGLFGKRLSKDGKRISIYLAMCNQKDLEELAGFAREGKLRPPVEKIYSLSEAKEAFQYIRQGHVKGKLVFKL
jgi:NADPH:quinone reductase-like Zn-dependent oxidoreductase